MKPGYFATATGYSSFCGFFSQGFFSISTANLALWSSTKIELKKLNALNKLEREQFCLLVAGLAT